MKISCPACAAKYSIADEKVQDRLAKIRCRKCGTTIVIDGKTSPPNVYAAAEGSAADPASSVAASPAGESGREYSVDFGDNDQRTLSLADVVAAYNAGEITADTFLWAEGMSDWQPLGEIAEVVDALHTASPSPAAASTAASQVASPPAPAAAPWEPPPVSKAPRESDAAIARAAARKSPAGASPGGRAPTADLFGSFETDDVATSAPQPDLSAATGARNESSVLFSLSALTGSAKPAGSVPVAAKPAASPAADPKVQEDSGLIDLRALTSAAPKQQQPETESLLASPLGVSPLGVSPLGVNPLGLASPLGGVESHVGPIGAPAARSNKTGLFVGAGIVLAALVIAIAFILRPSTPEPVSPERTGQAQAPAATETAAPTPVAAKPPATGTNEETAAPDAGGKEAAKAPVRATGARRSTARKSGEESKSSTSGPATEKKPAVKRSPCGCAPGDLQCAMRCAAGR